MREIADRIQSEWFVDRQALNAYRKKRKKKFLDTKDDFDQILAQNPGKLIVVDFFATWCGPCIQIAPFLESLSEKYPDVVFCKVDMDSNEETSEACAIDCMPTFQFYKDGKQVDSLEGADKEKLENMIVSNK